MDKIAKIKLSTTSDQIEGLFNSFSLCTCSQEKPEKKLYFSMAVPLGRGLGKEPAIKEKNFFFFNLKKNSDDHLARGGKALKA